MKHYLIYKTTNLINNKIYIGQHVTEDINDSYLGSGSLLLQDIKKYGRMNFKREILFELRNQTELDNKERELVNADFIKNENTYNLVLGAIHGLEHCDSSIPFYKKGGLKTQNNYEKLSSQEKENYSIKHKNIMSQILQEDKEKFSKLIKFGQKEYLKNHPDFRKSRSGIKHSNESKKKISDSQKCIDRYSSKNPMYNKIWIFNPKTGENIIWDKGKLLPNGWIKYKCNNYQKYLEFIKHNEIIKDIKYRQKLKKINKLYQIYNWYKKYGFNSAKKQFNIKCSRQTLLRDFNIFIKNKS